MKQVRDETKMAVITRKREKAGKREQASQRKFCSEPVSAPSMVDGALGCRYIRMCRNANSENQETTLTPPSNR
jgi:hypothetical protein